MKQIKLGKSSLLVTMVDDEDFDFLNSFSWYSCPLGYVYSHGHSRKRRMVGHKRVSMHRLILQACKGEFVDHIDGNPSNNQKSNLRFCNNQQNLCNQRKKEGTLYKYKGARFCPLQKKWQARIKFKNKEIHLGYFITEQEAALAYNKKAKELNGDFARLNCII